MSEILEKIKSRGHWRVVIRPATFVEKRIAERSALLLILENTSVQLKGWNFPHIDAFVHTQSVTDWIGQEIDWDSIVELWRFYQSGQFVHYSGMLSDWNEHSGTYTGWSSQWKSGPDGNYIVLLDIAEVLFRFAEIFEFASRLTFTEAGDDQMHLEVEVRGIQNHRLRVLPSTEPDFFREMSATPLPYKEDLSRAELIANTRELALQPATKLFQCFGWDPGIKILRDIQSDILRRGPAAVR